jgi:hypothetical protein
MTPSRTATPPSGLGSVTPTPSPTSCAACTGTLTASSTVAPSVAAAAAPGTSISYPSPASGSSVSFGFGMSQAGSATLKVLNSAGMLVSQNSQAFGAGPAVLPLDISAYAQGVYYYEVQISYSDGSSQNLALSTFVVVRP